MFQLSNLCVNNKSEHIRNHSTLIESEIHLLIYTDITMAMHILKILKGEKSPFSTHPPPPKLT